MMAFVTPTRLRSRLSLATSLLLIGSCDLLNAPLPFALEGTYDALWTHSAFDKQGARVGLPVTCAGELRIEQATDTLVTGSFIIRPSDGCTVMSGPLTGKVRRDGGLSLDAGTVRVWLGGCGMAGVPWSFSGIVERGDITASTRSAVSCPEQSVAAVQTDLAAEKR